MSIHSWKAQFGHKVTGYDAVEAQGLSELGYALKHNQILQDEYLNWARAQFEMCSLDMKFFHSQKPPVKLYERLKEVYPWSAECLPVAEWDNHVVIACLEKPQDVPAEFKPIFLLAPLKGLEVFWETFHQEKMEGAEESHESEEHSGESVMPEGFHLTGTSTKVNLSDLSLAGVTVTKAPAPQEEVEVKANPIILDESPVPNKLEIEIKAEPQVVAVASPDAPIDEAELVAALDHYKNHYEKRAFVFFDSVNKLALARLFPSDLILPQTPTPQSLEGESFLKIVAKTQKPYHGHLIKTPVTETFFKELNGQLPENVTAIPLINQDQVIGVFLGWGPKTTYTLAVLRDMQKVVDELSTKLGWVKVQAA